MPYVQTSQGIIAGSTQANDLKANVGQYQEYADVEALIASTTSAYLFNNLYVFDVDKERHYRVLKTGATSFDSELLHGVINVKAVVTTDVSSLVTVGTLNGLTPEFKKSYALIGQDSSWENGIYVLNIDGDLERHEGYDSLSDLDGTKIYATGGASDSNTFWKVDSTTGVYNTNGTVIIHKDEFVDNGKLFWQGSNTSDLRVNADVKFSSDVNISDSLTVGVDASITGNLSLTGSVDTTLTVDEDVTAGKDLTVTSDLTVGRNATITSDLTVSKNATITQNLTVTSDITVGDDLIVTDALSVSGISTLASTTTGQLGVGGSTYVNTDITTYVTAGISGSNDVAMSSADVILFELSNDTTFTGLSHPPTAGQSFIWVMYCDGGDYDLTFTDSVFYGLNGNTYTLADGVKYIYSGVVVDSVLYGNLSQAGISTI